MKVSVISALIYFACFVSQNISANESEDVPELVLLEFLGSFETDDDQWFDPTLLVDVEIFDEGLNNE